MNNIQTQIIVFVGKKLVVSSANSDSIKTMMTRVCNDLSNLLQNLSVLYKSNGINYNVKEYYNVIIRIIAPFQLLSHFHIVDNSTLFMKNPNFLSNQPSNTLKTNNFIPIPGISKIQLQVKPSQMSYPLRNPKGGWPKTQLNYHTYNNLQRPPPGKRGRKPLPSTLQKRMLMSIEQENKSNSIQNRVDSQMQEKLYQWIQNQTRFERKIQMVDICKVAKSLSKNANFLASSGWCANFLNRHPDIKKYIKRKKWRMMGNNEVHHPNVYDQGLIDEKNRFNLYQNQTHPQFNKQNDPTTIQNSVSNNLIAGNQYTNINDGKNIQYPKLSIQNQQEQQEYSEQQQSEFDQNDQQFVNQEDKYQNQNNNMKILNHQQNMKGQLNDLQKEQQDQQQDQQDD